MNALINIRGRKRKAPGGRPIGQTLWDADEGKDITVIADDKEIKVHKAVIIEHSTVFKAELESGLKEALEKKITIVDFSFNIVEAAMKSMYEVHIDINKENAQSLLQFADKYDIQALHYKSEGFLLEKVDDHNVFQMVHIASLFNAKELYDACISTLAGLTGKSSDYDSVQSLSEDVLYDIGLHLFTSTNENDTADVEETDHIQID